MNKGIITALLGFSLASCGGSNSNAVIDDPQIDGNQCLQPDRNQAWFEFLQKNYLWNEDLPATIDANAYASTSALLADLKSPQDRFSFVIDTAQWNNISSGFAFGYGMRLDLNESDDYVRIVYVFKNSGAANAGLTRGSRLTEINGVSAAQLKQWAISGDSRYSETLGPDIQGYQIPITWLTPDDTEQTGTLVKGTLSTNTVMANQVLTTNVGKTGYLSFQSGFIEPSGAELDTAFALFTEQGVDELVLDLRYNSGGRVDVAARLVAYIAGDESHDKTFVNYVYNDIVTNQIIADGSAEHLTFKLNSSLDQGNLPNAIPYTQMRNNALNLNRVVVLTTAETCSASELVINSLKPFVDVHTIGSATCGKPVGMIPADLCGETMLSINFSTTNANGEADYFNGITPTCQVNNQTVKGDWGENDVNLNAAINYLETGTCPVSAASEPQRISQNENQRALSYQAY
ncbi:S41 family peptidase [Algibacillus agarilyticus]|uniref:S41 family peptidase n=1 Tax=Algibacillus agarilyticus TaxID=2234133 RepID=UPI000DD04685|nr:S41 family peptidase [Algibacillus agarilyticus]